MNLKEARGLWGLTQNEMAALFGMHQSNYSRIETESRKPTIQQSERLNILSFVYSLGMLSELLNWIEGRTHQRPQH
jgi:transcriptional regulator with XRE-family HTH domain